MPAAPTLGSVHVYVFDSRSRTSAPIASRTVRPLSCSVSTAAAGLGAEDEIAGAGVVGVPGVVTPPQAMSKPAATTSTR